MPKVQKTCIYSKKSKVLIVKSHQTCIYSKKSKKSKISDSMWDSLAQMTWFLISLIFLSICRFGGFSLSKLLIIFEYMQVLCTFGIEMFFYFLSICRFGDFSLSKCLTFLSICRFEGLEVHQTCIYSKKATF